MKIAVFEKDINGKLFLLVDSPYHPDFISQAKRLGGKWNSLEQAWQFDPRDGDRIKQLCRQIYGTAGETVPLVDVKITLAGSIASPDYYLFGRRVLLRKSRDWDVYLGGGVVCLAGHFASRGGSSNHPAIGPVDDVELEIRDVPLELAERSIKQHKLVAIIIPHSPANSANVEELNKELFG